MSVWADDFVLRLLRATTLLTASATVVWITIRLLRLSSPRLVRVASVMVLIQGILLVPLPVAIPWPGPSSIGSSVTAEPGPRVGSPSGDTNGPEIRPVASSSRAPSSGRNWSLIALVIWLVGVAALPSASLIA
jgi:hypothetical protein